MEGLFAILFVLTVLRVGNAFSFVTKDPLTLLGQHCRPGCNRPPLDLGRLRATSANTQSDGDVVTTIVPLFNFSDPREHAVDKFERIDDAVMGGISLSSVRQIDNEDFARWSGVCRVDGG